METVENTILIKVKKARKGTLFFNSDFKHLGSEDAVKKALSRLEKSGEIQRIARGIYSRLRRSSTYGLVFPSLHEIAMAVSRRDRARIIPTGQMALYRLGLSQQIPLRAVYLTNGSPRVLIIGKSSIVFKKTAPKNLAIQGEKSVLAIQALKELGKDKFTVAQKTVIINVLKEENRNKLLHDIRLVPDWIRAIMNEAL